MNLQQVYDEAEYNPAVLPGGGSSVVYLDSNNLPIPSSHVVPGNGRCKASNQMARTDRWETGLCDCCSSCIPNCIMSCCCTWVTLAQVSARIGHMRYQKALYVLGVLQILVVLFGLGASSFTSISFWLSGKYDKQWHDQYQSSDFLIKNAGLRSFCQIMFLLLALVFALVMTVIRAQVRLRFRIPGDVCSDCCISCCCVCCAAAQMATHVKSYRAGQCSFAAIDELSAFEL